MTKKTLKTFETELSTLQDNYSPSDGFSTIVMGGLLENDEADKTKSILSSFTFVKCDPKVLQTMLNKEFQYLANKGHFHILNCFAEALRNVSVDDENYESLMAQQNDKPKILH